MRQILNNKKGFVSVVMMVTLTFSTTVLMIGFYSVAYGMNYPYFENTKENIRNILSETRMILSQPGICTTLWAGKTLAQVETELRNQSFKVIKYSHHLASLNIKLIQDVHVDSGKSLGGVSYLGEIKFSFNNRSRTALKDASIPIYFTLNSGTIQGCRATFVTEDNLTIEDYICRKKNSKHKFNPATNNCGVLPI